MATLTFPSKPSFLSRRMALGVTPAHVLVAGIMLLSVLLHFSNLEAIGDANTYYTAAVESMLQSWSNFFFVAAEPGGSVTIDKPPLGLWIEAAFAFVLGVEGWVVSLPNILAGVFSVPLLYHLVKKYLGEVAGLVAALVLVVTPVAIATDRNNTMDGMLVFTLLLAAWVFIAATETGKTRWLFLGAILFGLGFNIKMLQAFLPLPAFYVLYFLGAKTGWFRKLFNLAVATIILVIVSLSWAVIVDMTPPDQRPYIGSSDDNTVMELIVGHNGLSRLFGGGGNRAPAQDGPHSDGGVGAAPANPGGNNPRPGAPSTVLRTGGPHPAALAACDNISQGDSCSFTAPYGNQINGLCIQPPGTDQLACAPESRIQPNGQTPPAGNHPGTPPGSFGDGPNASPDGPPGDENSGGTPFSHETGSPGVARFFVYPLSKQMSWLLPFGLIGIVVVLFGTCIRFPLEPEHKSLVLWGGWLLTCIVFFSTVEGIFHAYYAIMLAPALGAVVGGGFGQLWRWQARNRWVDALLVLTAILTIAFQIYTAIQYGTSSIWMYFPILILIPGIGLLILPVLRRTGYLTILASMLTIPLIWTALTVFDVAPNVNLPTAFDSTQGIRGRPAPQLNERNDADQDLVAYLQANTQDTEYLVAVPNSHAGSPLVLETGRPVLYMGGFGGGDPVIDAVGLAEMVENGELRYVMYSSGRNNKKDISNWLSDSCTVVPEFSQSNNGQRRQDGPGGGPGGRNQPTVLYQCGT